MDKWENQSFTKLQKAFAMPLLDLEAQMGLKGFIQVIPRKLAFHMCEQGLSPF